MKTRRPGKDATAQRKLGDQDGALLFGAADRSGQSFCQAQAVVAALANGGGVWIRVQRRQRQFRGRNSTAGGIVSRPFRLNFFDCLERRDAELRWVGPAPRA